MSKNLRKRAFLSLCILFTLTFGLSFYLKIKSDTISKLNWSKYQNFVNTNGITIGFETFFKGKDEKIAGQLFFEALNSKEAIISKSYAIGAIWLSNFFYLFSERFFCIDI